MKILVGIITSLHCVSYNILSSASEATALWRYRSFIIIIIIVLYFLRSDYLHTNGEET